MLDVVALGELLIDFVTLDMDFAGYPTMKANPGGAPCNYLATLSAYDAKTAFIGKVGDDAFGTMLIDTMKQLGIDTSGICKDQNVFTTLAFVTLDDKGDRTFSFARKPGADTCLRYNEIDLSMIDNAEWLHFGTLSLTTEPIVSTTRKVIDYAKSKGKKISFDPNLRLPLWNNQILAKNQIEWGLRQADVVKISDEEVKFMWNDITYDQAIKKLLVDYGVKLVLLTLGEKGSYVANENACVRVRSRKVIPVDTTGAGDIFGGSAISCFLKKKKEPQNLVKEDLEDIGRFACATAGLSTQRQGGIPSIPKIREVYSEMEHNTEIY